MYNVNRDDLISQFVSITNSTIGAAADILRAAKWDLDQAINFYYEGGSAQSYAAPTVVHEQSHSSERATSPKKSSDKSPKFNKLRSDALEKRRWMVIYLAQKDAGVPILSNIRLRDLMNCRFLGLELSREESDGMMFFNFYNVRTMPYLCVIDPETKERVGEMCTVISIEKIYNFLRQFLIDHPKYGLPIDVELSRFEQEIDLSSSRDESSEENEEADEKKDGDSAKEKEEEESGEKISLMVQMPNGKKFKLEIGQDSKISLLYSKISALLKKNTSEFKLFKMPFTELSDMEKKLSEMGCKNCLIRVDEI